MFESDFSESVLIELEEYKEKFIDLKNTRNIEYIKLSSLEGGVATSNLIKNFVQLIDDLRSNRVNTVYIYCANNIGSFAATNLKKIGFKVEFIFDKDSNKYGVYKDFLVCKLKSSVILDNSSIVILFRLKNSPYSVSLNKIAITTDNSSISFFVSISDKSDILFSK